MENNQFNEIPFSGAYSYLNKPDHMLKGKQLITKNLLRKLRQANLPNFNEYTEPPERISAVATQMLPSFTPSHRNIIDLSNLVTSDQITTEAQVHEWINIASAFAYHHESDSQTMDKLTEINTNEFGTTFNQSKENTAINLLYRLNAEGKKDLLIQYIHPGKPYSKMTVEDFTNPYNQYLVPEIRKYYNDFFLPLKNSLLNSSSEDISSVNFMAIEANALTFKTAIDCAINDLKENPSMTWDDIRQKAMLGLYDKSSYLHPSPYFKIRPSIDINSSKMQGRSFLTDQNGNLRHSVLNKDEYKSYVYNSLKIKPEDIQMNLNKPVQTFYNPPLNNIQLVQKEIGSLMTASDIDGWTVDKDGKITQLFEMKTGSESPQTFNPNIESYQTIYDKDGKIKCEPKNRKNFSNQINFSSVMAKNIGAEYYMLYVKKSSGEEDKLALERDRSDESDEKIISKITNSYNELRKNNPGKAFNDYKKKFEQTDKVKIFFGPYTNESLGGQLAFTTYGEYSIDTIAKFRDIKALIDYDIRSHGKITPKLLAPKIVSNGKPFDLAQALDNKYKVSDFLNNDNISGYPTGYYDNVQQFNHPGVSKAIYQYAEIHKDEFMRAQDFEIISGDFYVVEKHPIVNKEQPVTTELVYSEGVNLNPECPWYQLDNMQKYHAQNHDNKDCILYKNYYYTLEQFNQLMIETNKQNTLVRQNLSNLKQSPEIQRICYPANAAWQQALSGTPWPISPNAYNVNMPIGETVVGLQYPQRKLDKTYLQNNLETKEILTKRRFDLKNIEHNMRGFSTEQNQNNQLQTNEISNHFKPRL